jgi:hypothetical protein
MARRLIIIDEIHDKCECIKLGYEHLEVKSNSVYAMTRKTYTSITSANIFGMCYWIICFCDENLIQSHCFIISCHNHGLSTTNCGMYPFAITNTTFFLKTFVDFNHWACMDHFNYFGLEPWLWTICKKIEINVGGIVFSYFYFHKFLIYFHVFI